MKNLLVCARESAQLMCVQTDEKTSIEIRIDVEAKLPLHSLVAGRASGLQQEEASSPCLAKRNVMKCAEQEDNRVTGRAS
eukprot:730688-Pelagomonas_calceolata.AAC.2